MTELEQAIARALASVARYRAGRTDLIPDVDLMTLISAAERVTKLDAALNNIDAIDPGAMIDGFSDYAIKGLVHTMGGIARAALDALKGVK